MNSVARDFVEAPSQMLENWCWEPTVLKRITSHYKTQEKLSDELIEKLIARCVLASLLYLMFIASRADAGCDGRGECGVEFGFDSRYVNIGLFSLRQLFFGTFDINVHTNTSDGSSSIPNPILVSSSNSYLCSCHYNCVT